MEKIIFTVSNGVVVHCEDKKVVSTIDGNSPSCRLFGDSVLFDNKINCAITARNEAKKYDK